MAPLLGARFVTGNEKGPDMGRPKKYATPAERQAAFKERYATLTIRVEPRMKEVIEELAQEQGFSVTDYVNSMLKFALTNRVWKTQGFYGKTLPRANPLENEE